MRQRRRRRPGPGPWLSPQSFIKLAGTAAAAAAAVEPWQFVWPPRS